MIQLFETVLYQPIFNLFIGLYDIIPDVGIAILLITLLIKLVLYPLTAKSIKAQRELQEIQPKLLELKKKYKTDQQKLAQETMKLYSEHKVNPFGSCLPILIQIPIFLALFWVLQDGLSDAKFDLLYSFVPAPESLNAVSLGIIDLSKPNIIMALLAGGAQYLQARTLTRKRATKPVPDAGKDEDLMAMMNKQMLYVLPVLTAIISMGLPSGVALYWFLSTIFTALQQHFLGLKADTPSISGTSDVIEGTVIEPEETDKK
jgi:YidC/Oxa1 family membrane protein insertase